MRKSFILIFILLSALLQAENSGDIKRLENYGFTFPDGPMTPPPLIAYNEEVPVELTRQSKVTVLYFWSSMVPSSLSDLTLLEELKRKMDNQNILFAPVNLNESPNLVRSTARTLGLTMEMFCFPEREALTPYILKSIPAAYILDSEGMLVASIQGNAPWSEPDVRRSLEELTGDQY